MTYTNIFWSLLPLPNIISPCPLFLPPLSAPFPLTSASGPHSIRGLPLLSRSRVGPTPSLRMRQSFRMASVTSGRNWHASCSRLGYALWICQVGFRCTAFCVCVRTLPLPITAFHVPTGGCGSMYAIDIASEAFQGVPMIKQHRMVNEILKEELKAMHGMQVNV